MKLCVQLEQLFFKNIFVLAIVWWSCALRRYVELKEQDVLKFGYSSREYVLLHEKSDTGEVAENESEGDEDWKKRGKADGELVASLRG